jgi:teichuronic acid exporter
MRHKALSATIWTGIDTFSRQGLGFVISIILARLLTPKEFGIIGLLALFTGIASVFIESGFTSALIQKRETSPAATSTVFFFNISLALIMALLLCLGARWFAVFYQMPILEPLSYVMALNMFISAFGNVQRTLMTIELDFRTPTRINIIATIVSGVLGIYLALRGCGVWSLAWQAVLSTFINNMLTWYYRPWRPILTFETQRLRELFGFGGFMMLSGLLDVFYNRLNTLLIGKFYSATDLGFYTRADRTQQLPGNIIGTLVGRIAFPLFAAANHDKELLRQGLKKSVIILMMVNLPIMLGICAVSRNLVLTLFGLKWESCIPYLQVLCLGGIFWPLHVLNLSALKAQGHSKLFFRLEVVKKIIGFTALAVSCPIGVLAMAWSQVFLGAVGFIINAYYSGVVLGYPVWRQMSDLIPYLLLSCFMAICVWLVGLSQTMPASLLFIVQVAVGCAVYVGLGILFKFSGFRGAIAIYRGRQDAYKMKEVF